MNKNRISSIIKQVAMLAGSFVFWFIFFMLLNWQSLSLLSLLISTIILTAPTASIFYILAYSKKHSKNQKYWKMILQIIFAIAPAVLVGIAYTEPFVHEAYRAAGTYMPTETGISQYKLNELFFVIPAIIINLVSVVSNIVFIIKKDKSASHIFSLIISLLVMPIVILDSVDIMSFIAGAAPDRLSALIYQPTCLIGCSISVITAIVLGIKSLIARKTKA